MISRGRPHRPARPGVRPGAFRPPAAFTLLELIVVVAVIGTVLVLTLPRLQLPGVHDDLEAAARQLIQAHGRLRDEAVGRQQRHTLHLDLDRQRIWITHAAMDEEQTRAAADEGYRLPRRVRLERLRLPEDRDISAGAYGVDYFPDGHSFMAAVELAESEGRRLTLRIEPFLSAVRVVDEDGTALPF